MLSVSELRFAHAGQPPLFDQLGFELPAGLTRLDAERGKTTLVRILAGDLPASGRFQWCGQAWQPGHGALPTCWLDPRAPAWDAMTPAQVAAWVAGRHAGFDHSAWERLLAAFDLGPHLAKTLHMLSTGSRRKVTLAAALASGAPITLLDEPTAGLDRPAIDALVDALTALTERASPAQPRVWLLAAAWGLEDRLPWAETLDF